MTITSSELSNGRRVYSLSDVVSMAGLEAVRGFVSDEAGVNPVDGSVILAEAQGHPHSEITYSQPVALGVIERAEEKGALETSRLAEMNLR